jgi:hypothetical protein
MLYALTADNNGFCSLDHPPFFIPEDRVKLNFQLYFLAASDAHAFGRHMCDHNHWGFMKGQVTSPEIYERVKMPHAGMRFVLRSHYITGITCGNSTF